MDKVEIDKKLIKRKFQTVESRNIVKTARKTLNMNEIAKICNVNVGTVKRWGSVNKAKLTVIQPLINLISYNLIRTNEEIFNIIEAEAGNKIIRLSKSNMNKLCGSIFNITRMIKFKRYCNDKDYIFTDADTGMLPDNYYCFCSIKALTTVSKKIDIECQKISYIEDRQEEE